MEETNLNQETPESEEKVKKTTRKPSVRKGITPGDKYLAAAIKSYDWIDEGYKAFAERYQDKPKELREIYLCACDGVPLDLMAVAENKEPAAESFSWIRKKHIEAQMQRRYADDLEEIRGISRELYQDVKNISDMVRSMADYVPFFDEMFPEIIGSKRRSSEEKENKEREDVPESGTQVSTGDVQTNRVLDANQLQSGRIHTSFEQLKEKVSIKFSQNQKKDSSKFIRKLYATGYQPEQIEFVLDCLAEGQTEREIKRFIAPEFPVDLMQRLKELEKIKEG
ncbi:MAG: hypothetical protein J6B26_01490 [Agathobacter sp.]|nr:hypothetical protein [Agathobacter sp.]MBP3568126.1 hypothetical protein [Lachnospiraceae bacterium]